MKKIFSRLFKWKSKSEHTVAPASVAAHEIALKHVVTQRRLQSTVEETDPTEVTGALENLDAAAAEEKKAARKTRQRLRGASEAAGATGEGDASGIPEAAVGPRKARANKRKLRAARVGSGADDSLVDVHETTGPSADETGPSVKRSGTVGRNAGKGRRRRNSSSL